MFLFAIFLLSIFSFTPVQHKKIGMPNPAAKFCVETGGRYYVVDTKEGQKGMCEVKGIVCDVWDYYAKCAPRDEVLRYLPSHRIEEAKLKCEIPCPSK